MNESIEMVCGFVFSPDGSRVLLLRKRRPDWQRDMYNGVGGKILPGESIVDAMVRKCRQEAGVATQPSDWTHCVTLHFDGGKVHFLRARPKEVPEEIGGEHDEPANWYRREILPLSCVGNAYWLIPLCFVRDIRFPVEMHDTLPVAEWGKGEAA